MILVKEQSPPLKMSGRSSFLVSFNYDQKIIDTIKQLPTYYYHKSITSWEIPVIYLASLLDKLTKLDDVKLEVINEIDPEISQTAQDEFSQKGYMYTSLGHENSTETILDTSGKMAIFAQAPVTQVEMGRFRMTPFRHQVEAINFMLRHEKSLLLDSMGVGKSLSMMYYAETLHARGLIDHCLVICGIDSLRTNWKNEIQKFSNESCVVLGERVTRTGSIQYESISKRVDLIRNTPISEFFVIVNITTLGDKAFLDALNDPKSVNHFGLICVDEAHKISATSNRGKNIMKLRAPYKVAATGTLITNDPISAYGPLVFTENDKATLTMFKSVYCEFGGFSGYDIVGYKNLELLKDEIDSCSIRRTLADVRSVDSDNPMPTKTIETELVDMDDADRKFYDTIKAGIKSEVDKINLNSSNLLALTTRLRQATECPGYLSSNPPSSTKLARAAELVSELASNYEKVVVLSTFKDGLNELARLLKNYDPLLATGDFADSVVAERIAKFQNDPSSYVLLGTHSKIGTGFSFPQAHYMVMLSTPWTDASFSQSCDRIYRITSDQNVFIKVLLCKNTFDERVMDIVNNKKELSDYLVDGVINNGLYSAIKDALMQSL